MVVIGCWLGVAMFVRIWFRFGVAGCFGGFLGCFVGLGLVALVLVGCLLGGRDVLFQGVW